MGMNNNNKQQQLGNLGLVDTISPDPSIKQTQSYLEADSRPPVDASSPSTTSLPFEANNEVLHPMPGTILSDTYHHFTDQGVETYSTNTSAQSEAKARREQQETIKNRRSIYQTPVTQTPSVAPNVDDGQRPTEEQLALLKTRDRLITINNKLRLLQLDEQRYETKLANVRRAMKSLRLEAEDLS